MSPRTPILAEASPKKCSCFAEMDNFLVENGTPSASMAGVKILSGCLKENFLVATGIFVVLL
jgi:hypothetical protein